MKKEVVGKMVKAGKNFTGVYFRREKAGWKTFYIVFRADGRLVWERVGREAEGFTARKAQLIRKDRLVEGTRPAATLTLNEAFQKHVLTLQAAGDKAPYISQVAFRYNRFVRPVLGMKGLQEISVEDLNGLKVKLLEEYAPSYIKSILRGVKEIYTDMIESRVYQGFNPTSALRFKRSSQARNRALSIDESLRLLDELRRTNVDVYQRTMFALYTGLRKGEIASLTPADIDLELGEIRIRDAKSPNEEHKTRKAFFPEQLAAVIKEIYTARKLGNSDLLFPNPFRDDVFIDTVRGLGLNEGRKSLDRLTFHGLRHTHATLIGGLSKDPYVVKDQLGHGDIAMSMTYTHVQNRSSQYVQLLGERFAQREAELLVIH